MEIKGRKIYPDPQGQSNGYKPSEWRLCEVNGRQTGIIHLPSWTFFNIEGDTAKALHIVEINAPSAEELQTLSEDALEVFRHGMASWKPRRGCSHPHP
jgi:hypothetical protein